MKKQLLLLTALALGVEAYTQQVSERVYEFTLPAFK